MDGFMPSADQAGAMQAFRQWWNHGRPHFPVFVMKGPAGSGKSTLIGHLLGDLGLEAHDEDRPGVMTLAYTAKAASVLRRRGTPARTIHSAIYRYIDPEEEDLDAFRFRIEGAERRAQALEGDARDDALRGIEAMRRLMAGLLEPQFVLDHVGSDLVSCRLVVLDESSMVGERIARDVFSFGKPVLVVGDPYQLPPIGDGDGFFNRLKADVMLTEVHRQALESPILRLATLAREGDPIPFGVFGPGVAKIRRRAAPPESMARADQVICGRNVTRRRINAAMRVVAGHGDSPLPVDGERVICRRNDPKRGMINGEFYSLRDVRESNGIRFEAKIFDEAGEPVGTRTKTGKAKRQRIYRGYFDDHVSYDEGRAARDWKERKSLVMLDYAYAITGHNAQGDQFRNVIVWDEPLRNETAEHYRRRHYTCITRARDGLCIVA
jgi:exodeoxyribonuclease-5